MLSKFLKYISHSVAAMVGLSVYILADTFFISVHSGANGLAVLNLILPIYGLIYAIGSMIGIGSATRYSIRKARGKDVSYFFMEAILWSVLISIPFVLVGIYIPDSVLTVLGVASYGVIANLALVAVAIFNGLAQGSQPLISQCYGKSEGDNIKRLLSWSVKTCLIVENAIILISWIFTDALIAIFNSENNLRLLNLAHNGLRLYFLGFIFAGINVMLVSYFSAIDRAAVAIVGSLMRGFVAIIILAIVLANMFGENGVWISFLGSEIITFITIILTDTLQKKKKTGVSL